LDFRSALKGNNVSIDKGLMDRSGGVCELCGSNENLSAFAVAPKDDEILVCGTCSEQLNDSSKVDANHWRCLNDSMWSVEPAVQVVVYRMLNALKSEGWPQDLLDQMYLEPEVVEWAQEGMADENREPTRDSNGTILEGGDAVTIIKDLEVKGAGFTAKRGTMVKNISLTDNPEQIEGRVNGTRIVLLSKFLKKS
jgi:protein PhnA